MIGRIVSGKVARRFGRDVEVSVAAGVFLSAAALVAVVLQLPMPSEAERSGLTALAIALGLFGLTLAGLVGLTDIKELSERCRPSLAGAAIAACTAGLYFNGERLGSQPLFNDVLYVWPALYLGYRFHARDVAKGLGVIAAAYAATLAAIPQPASWLVPRFFVIFSTLVITAAAVHVLRRHIEKLVGGLNDTARTDGLTGLLNRRAFDEQLRGELNRAIRTQSPFCLLLSDIDFFKKLNDEHGHAAGDQALKLVAEALKDGTRDMDTVGRIGGEEFAVILPATEMSDAIAVAERLRAAITASSPNHRLTMSMGVVSAPKHSLHPEELLKKADEALYKAKAAGRDRVVTPEWLPSTEREPTLRERVQALNRTLEP